MEIYINTVNSKLDIYKNEHGVNVEKNMENVDLQFCIFSSMSGLLFCANYSLLENEFTHLYNNRTIFDKDMMYRFTELNNLKKEINYLVNSKPDDMERHYNKVKYLLNVFYSFMLDSQKKLIQNKLKEFNENLNEYYESKS